MSNKILTLDLKEKIKIHAEYEKPNEACGLIYKSGEFIDIYPCKNISSEKKEHFELNPFDYLKAANRGKIVGMYHSQKDINPSVLDYVVSSGHKMYSVVYSYENDTFVEINEGAIKYAKYIGRPFELGKQDCYSLIMDFYKQEYGIILNNYFRDDKKFEQEPDIIRNNYQKEGFEEIKVEDLQIGDAIVFGLVKTSPHVGIFIGNNLFLHHERAKYSTAQVLTSVWKNKIVFCARHKNK
jgi:proteasome lid subunit RPN8/RPN11